MKYKNNFNSVKQIKSVSMPSKQNGVALLGIVIVLLLIIGLLSVSSAKNTVLETKIVFNLQDKQRSFMAAESAAQFAWDQVKQDVDIMKVINNSNEAGYYVLGNKIPTSDKSSSDWQANKNVVSWPWQDTTERFEIPQQLGGAANPMKLAKLPQYAVGMHNSVIRQGTSNYRCLPMTIIGASQGGTSQTRTLIELKTMPKSTCFRDKIK